MGLRYWYLCTVQVHSPVVSSAELNSNVTQQFVRLKLVVPTGAHNYINLSFI